MSKDFSCPYEPCGSHEYCIGCVHDPEKREMTYEEFIDLNAYICCHDCQYCDVRGEQPNVVSPCKRIDHKTIQRAIPWFKSYDCNGSICSEFIPVAHRKWLKNHWKPDFNRRPVDGSVITLVLNGDQSVRYEVTKESWWDGSFKDENGNLKWIRKYYCVRSKISPTGYEIEYEYPDGRKERSSDKWKEYPNEDTL